ncbi:MAG: DUF1349 domain-containing protein [Eudoraea sp.]|nr:DUF1349 domain-containing protein [Eudoraea sp.]
MGQINNPASKSTGNQNLISGLSQENLGDFTWMNVPDMYLFSPEGLSIETSQGTDFFNNPENGEKVATAPYLYQELAGDFVAIAKVKPNFQATWNACSLLAYIDENNWIKFAFENSDATGPSIVSVVTRGVSDDANGVVLASYSQVWLKFIRKGNLYAMHWSTDGINYKMSRLSAMPDHKKVRIGMEAQCPSEGPAIHSFLSFSLERNSIEDLRKGE